MAGLASPVETFQPADIEAQSSGIIGQIHEHHVPEFVIDALDRLYGSLYASYRYQQLCDPSVLPHVWIGYRCGELVGALLFDIHAERIRVMTEMFTLSEELASAFCRDVFGRYPDVRQVDFNAVGLPSRMSQLACQHFAFSENYVLQAPASVEQYEQALGKSTRKTLRGYRNRLLREHPGFEWRCCTSDELPRHAQRALVRQLQEFKRVSMATRGKQAQSNARETAQLLLMAAHCGLYGLGTIDGKLCAGSLALRIGDTYVMLLCAADPAFSSYRLGLLACYWALCDCIRQGARQCHLLWGRYRYKEQLLALPVSLHRMRVYRSHWHMLVQPGGVMRMAARGLLHRCRFWLLNELPHRRDWLSRGLFWLAKKRASKSQLVSL